MPKTRGHAVMDDAFEADRRGPTVLVTGVDTMLGANLALHLSNRLRVVGFCRDRLISLDGCETTRWDPANAVGLSRRVRRASPQWIVHCGSVSHGDWDILDTPPDGSKEASTCLRLARIAADSGIRLTVVSTDAVFTGPRIFHDEASAATSDRPLARAARQVEQALEGTAALVVRTHAYGWSLSGAEPGLAERAWQALIDGLPCRFDPNQCATPILASDLAELLWRAYRRGLQGLYHIAGAERTSAYRFAWELAQALGLPSPNGSLEGNEAEPLDSTHVKETSLDTRRARRELQRPMPMLREGLQRFVEQLRDGTRDRLRALGRAKGAQCDAA